MNNKLRVLAPAKVNLYLRVLARRPDGYHGLRTVFHTVGLWDEVRLASSRRFRFTATGLTVPAGGANLCVAAYRLLKDATGTTREASLHLVKRIPAGAGLGGGSADAAATLAGLNRLWDLRLGRGRLAALAARLGSDVPFFLTGGAALGVGRGERLRPLASRLSAWAVLLKPRFGVPTREAYRALDRSRRGTPPAGPGEGGILSALRTGSLRGTIVHNDFTPVVAALHPKIRTLLGVLETAGAESSFLTGSGSAVVGLVRSPGVARRIARALSARHRVAAYAVRLAPLRLRIETT